jgi:hypothetical protein
MQYMTFSAFTPARRHDPAPAGVMPAMFLATVAVVSDYHSQGFVLSPTALFGESANALATAAIRAFSFGALLNHFWLDAHFWRFKDPESRRWMTSRYGFLFERWLGAATQPPRHILVVLMLMWW